MAASELINTIQFLRTTSAISYELHEKATLGKLLDNFEIVYLIE